ncbi:MAG: hypothetical protein ACTTKH_07895 [Treponema sp.]
MSKKKNKSQNICTCKCFCKSIDDKPNAMDVYNLLWKGRDFELSYL